MSSHNDSPTQSAPLDLSSWRSLPGILMVVGGIGVIAGWATDPTQFAFSWLLAYMFFLSLGLGLRSASSCCTICSTLPGRCPSGVFASKWLINCDTWCGCGFPSGRWLRGCISGWSMAGCKRRPTWPHRPSFPLFTTPGFFITSIFCLLVWLWLSSQLRGWSLKQDQTGSVECTRMMRRYSAFGIFLFAITLSLAAIMWMKALEHEWFSTMYGVYYFAASMWLTLATVYVIVLLLQRQGPLQGYVHEKTYYFIGSLLFAFTVFYAYVTFAQYFIIWNANVPEETFWFVLREKGTYWDLGQIIIFGHFFLPFLLLLRIDWKLKLSVMGPLFVWVWLMHFVDMSFNIIPVLHPETYHLDWRDLACMAFIGGVLSSFFIKNLNAHPILPQKDPRFAESQEIYVPHPDQFVEAATSKGIEHKIGGGH